MKILFITGSLNQGGAEYQLLLLAKLLRDKGLDAEVVAITNYDYYLPFVKQYDIPYSCVSNEGSSLLRLIRAVRLIRSKKPDIAISYIKRVSQVAVMARVLSGFRFKLIISERTSLVQWWHDFYYFNIALLANRVTVNSVSKYNYIRNRFPLLKGRTVFIPNLLDTKKFLAIERKPSANGAARLSYIGRISPEKNLINLIKAIRMVADKGHDVTLKLYGEANNASYLKELQNLITELGLEKRVEYIGPADDVTGVYSETDLLCLVSLYEGFSNVLSEALAAGVPVLASDIEENRYLVENQTNGFLVNPKGIISIYEGIDKFLALTESEVFQISNCNKSKARTIFNEEEIYKTYCQCCLD